MIANNSLTENNLMELNTQIRIVIENEGKFTATAAADHRSHSQMDKHPRTNQSMVNRDKKSVHNLHISDNKSAINAA